VQRGVNRQACFASDSDLKAYANWLHEGATEYGLDIHAWVFMTNHVHLLVTPHFMNSVSKCMQYLGRHYVRFFNHRYQRTGTLFEGRFRSCLVQGSKYFLACQRYIELNPVRAAMVKDPADYTWSSYGAHAHGQAVRMWQPHSEYMALGLDQTSRLEAYRKLFVEDMNRELVLDIRKALNTGLALGNDSFRKEVEQLTSQRQHHLKRGPTPKPPA
jgi:putative transposase